MKLSAIFAVLIVLVVIFGCGGGGSSTSTSTATSTSTTTSTSNDTIVTRMIAVDSLGKYVDPTNLQPGNIVTFKVAAVDLTADTYHALPTNGFTTNDTTSQAGTLNASSGVFQASNPTGTTQYTVSAVSTGTSYQMLYAVTPLQARVSGSIIDTNNVAAPFIQVLFFDAGHNQVGQVTSQPDGTFNASLPATAVRFNLNTTTIPTATYFNYFAYATGSYSPLNYSACSAPLPGLINGSTVPLPSTVFMSDTFTGSSPNTPPPPPSCMP